MPRKIVDTILPTTMVGSYPRPHWFDYQLLGRDVRVAFKHVDHAEAYEDATHAVIHDQEEAGLDIVTDGQMSYDDYVGVIGSFCWYMYERIPGFEHGEGGASGRRGRRSSVTTGLKLLSDWGGVINSGPVERGPIRLVDLYKIASRYATKPIKVSVGAGPVNLAWHVYYEHYKDPKELSYALAPIFNAEMKDLVEAGATFLQLEDLGAWLPLFTGDDEDYKWIADVMRSASTASMPRSRGTSATATPGATGSQTSSRPATRPCCRTSTTCRSTSSCVDFANREMADIDSLKGLPEDKEVAVGVLDIRTSMVESPEQIADRIRKVIEIVPPERVYLTTDCGMKPLARMVAKMKLRALVEGAQIVRDEIG